MTINFYIDNQGNKVEKTLFIYIRGIGGKNTIKLHSGEKINPKFWSKKNQRCLKSYTGHLELNERLTNLKSQVQKIHRDLLNDNPYATYEDFKIKIDEAFKRNDRKLLGFFNVFDLFLDIRKKELTESSIKKFKVLKNHLTNFSKVKNYKISFERIDLFFYDYFVSYLMEDKGLINNSIFKLTGMFKIFMNWAVDRNFTSNLSYKKFKMKENSVENTYLEKAELMKLFNSDLSKNKTWEKVRDIFCFACFTGHRFSDVTTISWEDMKSDTNGTIYWHLRTQKTKDILKIPLNQHAIQIIEKYKGESNPLPKISHQKSNVYIKEILKEAGINDLIRKTRYRGSEKIEKYIEKYDLVGMHTPRRTFLTLWLEEGGRPETAMAITGIKDFRTLKRYIVMTDKVKGQEMEIFSNSFDNFNNNLEQ